MDSVSSYGQTNLLIAVTSLTTIFMVMEDIDGLMVASTVATGSATKCTALVSLPGLTAGSMMDSTSTIRSKVTEFLPGPMEDNMTVHG